VIAGKATTKQTERSPELALQLLYRLCANRTLTIFDCMIAGILQSQEFSSRNICRGSDEDFQAYAMDMLA